LFSYNRRFGVGFVGLALSFDLYSLPLRVLFWG